MPGLAWYLLITFKAYKTSGRVHDMTYMIEPIAEAYDTLLIMIIHQSKDNESC
jgi:hypothetical protein